MLLKSQITLSEESLFLKFYFADIATLNLYINNNVS